MIQAIRSMLALDITVTLVNIRGCIIEVSSVAICDIGIYDSKGKFYSTCSLSVLQYIVLK